VFVRAAAFSSGLALAGAAGVFFWRGVGEGSTRAGGRGFGVGSRPRGAGEAEVFFFTARRGLTRVALGVICVGVDGSGISAGVGVVCVGVDGSGISAEVGVDCGAGLGLEPEAVCFRPAGGVGVSSGPFFTTYSPSLSARAMR
jgi:hypothetical protein